MCSSKQTKAVLVVLILACSVWAASDDQPFTARQRQHWAYQPVHKPNLPVVKDQGWVKTPVDAFILSALEAKGLKPAPPAEKITLLRRATFDLTGLPPTPDEVRDFLDDRSPRAFEKVV